MSFELLREEIVDAGLCQGCGLCAGSCKHIEMEVKRPTLKDYCILEREGQDCGKCYQNCPQVIQKKFEEKQPLAIYSLRSKNPEILVKASSLRFKAVLVTSLTTISGLFPTAYGVGGSDSMLIPMTMAMAWGLTTGTIFTLVWIPCAYGIIEDGCKLFGKVLSRDGKESTMST